MATDLPDPIPTLRPTPTLPLRGQTLLVVDDSRTAADALRLMALTSGARIRRAGSLTTARRHLAAYRPGVVLIDLGLPDGSGLSLVGDLSGQADRPALIALSADDALSTGALSAGADAFLVKPIASLAQFQATILAHMPAEDRPKGPRPLPVDGDLRPDDAVLRDDLAHALTLLAKPDSTALTYAAQFTESVAQVSSDPALLAASRNLRQALRSAVDVNAQVLALCTMLRDRLIGLPRV